MLSESASQLITPLITPAQRRCRLGELLGGALLLQAKLEIHIDVCLHRSLQGKVQAAPSARLPLASTLSTAAEAEAEREGRARRCCLGEFAGPKFAGPTVGLCLERDAPSVPPPLASEAEAESEGRAMHTPDVSPDAPPSPPPPARGRGKSPLPPLALLAPEGPRKADPARLAPLGGDGREGRGWKESAGGGRDSRASKAMA